MPKSSPPPVLRPAAWLIALALTAPVLQAAPTDDTPSTAARTGTAEPDNGPDALMRLVAERSLQPIAAAQALGQAVRDRAGEMVLSAMSLLGVRYKFGGNDAESGFDCSGFTRHVFQQSLGLLLPRRAEEQAQSAGLAPIAQDQLAPGDLVFFNTMKRTFSHVGIYVGNGKFVHAPRSGANVRVEDMRVAYWAHRYDGARRAPTAEAPAAR